MPRMYRDAVNAPCALVASEASLPRVYDCSVSHHTTTGEAMNRRHFVAFALWAAVLAGLQPMSLARADEDWIATWTASPHEVWAPDFLVPVKVPRNLWGQTVRQIAQVSIGGQRVRVVLSNEYGPWPVKIGGMQIALSANGSAIAPGSSKPLTFGGKPSIVIPPGAPAISDPVDLGV